MFMKQQKRSWWIDPKHNNSISVPIGMAKLFNDAGFFIYSLCTI